MKHKAAVRVEDIMVRRVEVLSPDAVPHDAVGVLMKRGYSGAPVVGEDGTLLGMFSEHDCIDVLAEAVYQGWPTGTVGSHMTKDPLALAPSDDLAGAARLFRQSRHRSLPVVQEGRVVGIVGRRDLIRALDRMLEADGPRTTYELLAARR